MEWVICEKEEEGCLESKSFVSLLDGLEGKEQSCFEEKELSIQRLKFSFVYFLWSETKLSIKDGPLTLVDFVGRVATR